MAARRVLISTRVGAAVGAFTGGVVVRCCSASWRSRNTLPSENIAGRVSIQAGSFGLLVAGTARSGEGSGVVVSRRERSNKPSSALNTSWQWPQRTQPSETFSWSCTTRKTVPQEGQDVARLMPESCHCHPISGASGAARCQQHPAIFTVCHFEREPRRVGGLQLLDLAL